MYRLLLVSLVAVIAPAQTFRTLKSFNGSNGSSPQGTLAQGIDGNFYGTTVGGGAHHSGTIFKITPAGALTTLYSFTGATDGLGPSAGLVLAPDGNFYGTTPLGGAFASGTVFRVTPAGVLATLYSFTGGVDGSGPTAGLLLGVNGLLYGTTALGGDICCGTIFSITTAGTLATLYSFTGSDGSTPDAALVESVNGDLYGTAASGGSYGYGTIFKITTGGAFTALYSFMNGSDGAKPYGALALGFNQEFYGTTRQGGVSGDGTIFEITTAGALTPLYSFAGGADEGNPIGGLVQANDGNLYGTTSGEYVGGSGTIFKVAPHGALTTLHTFGGTGGSEPYAGLLQATNGDFYGATSGGGSGHGTVFGIALGLPPLVKPLPRSGAVDAAIMILGSNLTGATEVSFNGTPAAFSVVSSTEIMATVPTGATTGTLTVTTPSGIVSGSFLVMP